MRKLVFGIAAAALVLGACEADRSTSSITQPSNALASSASVSEASVLCSRCTLGPLVFTRKTGTPVTETIHFSASPVPFVVDIDDLGSQGASADVSLNGIALLKDGSPSHVNQLLVLTTDNALVVRLTGKPGSQLRVAVWLFKPATLELATLAPRSTLQIEGSPVAFDATIANHTNAAIPDVSVETWLVQSAARRRAGSSPLSCGPNAGVLSLTECVQENSIHASNLESGNGTLVPGDALAVIRLVRSGSEVLDSLIVPIVLTPAPAVVSVAIEPRDLLILPGDSTRVTANVEVVGGAPKSVTWSISGYPAVSVSPEGVVKALGIGLAPPGTMIVATSTADPSKRDSIPVAVYAFEFTSPPISVSVATGPSTSAPQTVNLQASVCRPLAYTYPRFGPFLSVEFSALLNGMPVVIGTGTWSYEDTGGGIRCWRWDLPWTPGNAFGLGLQTLYATATPISPFEGLFRTRPYKAITTVAP